MYDLTYFGLAMAAALIVVNAAVSLVLRLNLERRLLWAALRTVVQLSLLGLILQGIFATDQPLLVGGMMLFMTAVAGISAVQRTERRFAGIWGNALIAAATGSWVVTFIVLAFIIPPHVWSARLPQYAIPLLGMVLGNTLNGLSLGIDRFTEELVMQRGLIEMRLCLGATRWEAAREPIRNAVRTGMIPIINSMSVVGLVSLPGMMTGQLLAGAEAMTAVKYQIMIMFVIAAGTALGTVTAVLLSYRRLFNARHQLQVEQIRSRA